MSRRHNHENAKPFEMARLRNGHEAPTVPAILLMERLLMDLYSTIDGEELIQGLWRFCKTEQLFENPLDDGSESMLISLGYLRDDHTMHDLVRNVVLSAVVSHGGRIALQSPFVEPAVDHVYRQARQKWTWLPKSERDCKYDVAPARSLIGADEDSHTIIQLANGVPVPRDAAIQAMVALSPLKIREPIDTHPAWIRLMLALHQVCWGKEIDVAKRKELIRQDYLARDGTPSLALQRVVKCALTITEKEIWLKTPFSNNGHLQNDYLRSCEAAKIIEPANPKIRMPLSLAKIGPEA